MQGALLSGLIGAAAAIVGFGLASALRGPISRLMPWPAWRKYGHVAVGVVLFVGVLALGRGLLMGNGGGEEEKAMRELRAVPFMAAIIEADPSAEAEIRAIVREGVRSKNQQQITQRFARFTAARLPVYFKAASDDSVVAFAAAMVPLFKELERTDADACKQAIFLALPCRGSMAKAGWPIV